MDKDINIMGGININKLKNLITITLIFVIANATIIHGEEIRFYPDKLYHSKDFINDVNSLLFNYGEKYPSLVTVEKAGDSYMGNEILYLKIGKGDKSVFINASHHGKEYMTTLLVMNQIDYLVNKYQYDKELQELFNEVSIVFLPMVNPDGISIARGYATVPSNVITIGNSSSKNSFLGWKANGKGVDLNRNYPMRWDYIKDDPGKPANRNYKGKTPFSEVETNIVKDLCEKNDFEVCIAYHSAGEVIFWYAYQNEEQEKRDLAIGQGISKITGYRLDMTRITAGGMKDWFVQEYGKPGFTIEIGSPKYVGDFKQLPYSEYAKIWTDNRNIPEYLLKLAASSKQNDANEQGEESKNADESNQLQDGSDGHGLHPSE
ncbi:M14 family zinc carboxypeptidase [Lutispora thermophila]|nr:M14 family zinc carboxypeptidase [Lutispora thermophila]